MTGDVVTSADQTVSPWEARIQASCAERAQAHTQSGVVAEWSKAAGLGPVLVGGVGSNPADIQVTIWSPPLHTHTHTQAQKAENTTAPIPASTCSTGTGR